jgi:hypothetical protein
MDDTLHDIAVCTNKSWMRGFFSSNSVDATPLIDRDSDSTSKTLYSSCIAPISESAPSHTDRIDQRTRGRSSAVIETMSVDRIGQHIAASWFGV